tara:strand:- start:110 stop:391 length:282 start_codon:yes stop_codon:yes gene_type:complete
MTWEDTLKGDDWVPKRIGSKDNPLKPKETDRVIEYMKRNRNDVPIMSIVKDLQLHMSTKRLRKFLNEHPDITSRKEPIGYHGAQKTLYRYIGE